MGTSAEDSMTYLSRAQVREIDRRAMEDVGIAGIVLMENAGRGVVDVLLRLHATAPIHIVCGKGNNAGDGFVIARHLHLHGIDVIVHRCAPASELAGDALINYRILERMQLPIVPFTTIDAFVQQLRQAAWIVDALLGTGLTGTVRQPYDQVIASMNASGRPIVAVDLPSGLNADTGEPLGIATQALHTVTLVARKLGFRNPAAERYTGQVHVASIGFA